MKTYLGIDIGTQSVKALLYDAETKATVALATQKLDLISRSDGTREQEAHWWTDALALCLQRIDHSLKSTIQAISVSGQQHGFVPLSASGKVLAPVKLWCDTSTVSQCEEIVESIGGKERCIALMGSELAPGFTSPKLLWLKQSRPALYAQLATVLLPHDYLNFFLTGRRCMEHGDASGTGLFDVRSRQWSSELLAALDPERDLRSSLPELLAHDAIVGTILPERAKDLGLPESAIVATGGGDNMMGAIGTGNIRSGCLTASLGTSGVLYAYSDTAVTDPEGHLAGFCSSSGGWLPLLCTMNCTIATEKLLELLGLGIEEANTLAELSPVGANGIITIPYYNGERTPNLPEGKAVLYGLEMINMHPSNLIRSAMEAAIFGLKMGLIAFSRQNIALREVTLIGGGSKSRLWRQITADVLNLPVRVLHQEENAAFGAVIQAIYVHHNSCGHHVSLADIAHTHLTVDESKSCTPQPQAVAQYERIYNTYTALLGAVKPIYRLALENKNVLS